MHISSQASNTTKMYSYQPMMSTIHPSDIHLQPAIDRLTHLPAELLSAIIQFVV